MKKYIRFLTISFFMVALLCTLIYFALVHFESKVKEEYSLLMQHSQKVLQVTLDNQSADLYLLCILDYHINPNGNDMLNECSKINAIQKIDQRLNTKIETPYYDFYMQYMQGGSK